MIPSQWLFFTDSCFSFTSTLVDTLCSMDVSQLAYLVSPYHVPPARVLMRFLSILRVSSYLYHYGLSTRTLTFLTYVFLFSSRRLVYAYHYCLCFSFCSLSTRLPSRYFWTLTRY